jgi:hypothetical protein
LFEKVLRDTRKRRPSGWVSFLVRLPHLALAAECAAGVALTLIFLATTFAGVVAGYSPPTTTIFRWFAWARLIGSYDHYGVQAILVTSSLCAIAALIADRLGGGIVEELNRGLERFLSRWGFPIIAALFIFTVSGTWAGLVRVQDFNGASIGGMVPFSDAGGYASAAYDAVDGGFWNAMALRRPFAAAMREILLISGGLSYANALLLQATVAAFATWLGTRSVVNWMGAAAGFAFLCLAFAIQRSYLSTTLTEPLGLIWSLFSIPFFVIALRHNSLAAAYVALGLTTVTLLTRMGAMFLVPAIVLWILLSFGKTFWQKCRILAVCSVILVTAISLNQLLTRLYGAEGNLTGSNFYYSLCGLSIGSDWSACPQKYANEIREQRVDDEKKLSSFLLAKSLNNIRHDPKTLLLRLVQGGVGFVKTIPAAVTEGYVRPPRSKIVTLTIFVVIASCGLVLSALLYWTRREAIFWLLAFASIVASSAFVYFDDGLRVMSASYPLLALLWVQGLRQPRNNVEGPPSEPKIIVAGSLIAAAICICFLTVPALTATLMRSSSPHVNSLSADYHYIYGGRRVSGFIIVSDHDEPLKNVPSMTLSEFQAVIKSSGVELYQGLVVGNAPPPTPFAFIYAPRAEPQAQGGYSYIAPPDVLLNKAVPIWRLTVQDWHKKPEFGAYWFLVTRAEPVADGH